MQTEYAPGDSHLVVSRSRASELTVDVVIPALNEERALPAVLAEIPGLVRRIIVADNGSSDGTSEAALDGGAEVVREEERGYGAACLRAIARLCADPPDIVVFLDGDHSDHPAQLPALLKPILEDRADLVIGSRALGQRETGSLTPQQIIGNAIACAVLRRLYGVRYTDLGPFRAIRWRTLQRLGMVDRNFGWTVEMQLKAARLGVPYEEVPVDYRRRIGLSKVSGTIKGTLGASTKILWTLARYATWR